VTDGPTAANPPRPALYPAAMVAATEPMPGMHSTVAIIMRTKNRTLLLHRALSSVLLQTHRDWRLYLVNDGGDAAALEAMLARYRPLLGDRLTLIHHAESQGMERASNAGLSRAAEELVVVHDDDDAWHPDFLATAARFLASQANRHFVAVATACTVVTERIEDGEVREVGREVWKREGAAIDFRRMLVENQFPPISLVFRRSAVAAIGGYNGELPVLGDWEFNIRLMLLGDIGYMPQPLAYYHHRVAGTNSAYSNTVVDADPLHKSQNIRLRNAVLRAALAGRPEALGLLQPVLHALDEAERTRPESSAPVCNWSPPPPFPEWRLERIERELAEHREWLLDIRTVASWQRKMLRPVQWSYARLRRLLGR
jgi:glycosyltransferase involved in cell wall biosynthesis